MRRPTALHAGLSVFTTIAVRPIELDRRAARGAILALPWVGMILGGLAGAASWLVVTLGGGSLLAGVTAVAVLALTTGALHLDGLADTADGLGSRKPPETALGVMAKSDIGPMGVATLVLVLLAQVGALTSPRLTGIGMPIALLAMPMVGRVTALVGTLAPPARPGGFGSLFAGVASRRAIAVDVVAVAAVTGGLGAMAGGVLGALIMTLAALAAWAVGWGWHRHLLRHLGGFTGDTLGSLIEVTQLVFVVGVALAL